MKYKECCAGGAKALWKEWIRNEGGRIPWGLRKACILQATGLGGGKESGHMSEESGSNSESLRGWPLRLGAEVTA